MFDIAIPNLYTVFPRPRMHNQTLNILPMHVVRHCITFCWLNGRIWVWAGCAQGFNPMPAKD